MLRTFFVHLWKGSYGGALMAKSEEGNASNRPWHFRVASFRAQERHMALVDFANDQSCTAEAAPNAYQQAT